MGPFPILMERVGVWQLVRELWRTWYAMLVRPKAFFGAIGRGGRPRLGNALGYAAIALFLYITIQSAFEAVLIQRFNAEGTYLAYYAAPYEAYGWPLSHLLSFGTVVLVLGGWSTAYLLNFAVNVWLFIRWYVHFGEMPSFRSIFVSSLYGASFVMLTFCLLSVPLMLLASRDDPALFYFFGPLTAESDTGRYQWVLYYFYVRAVSFTTNIMLHWGLVFTALAIGGFTLLSRLF